MILRHKNIDSELRKELIAHVYGVIGCMHKVCEGLPSGLPEYVYQEAFKEVVDVTYPGLGHKEYECYPLFNGHELKAAVRMDFMVEMPETKFGNVIVECKAIRDLRDHERQQLFSYMIATGYRVGVLVNFATYPKAQIERYYMDTETMEIGAF